MNKVCLIGYPAKHSLSPGIHGYWLEKYGIKGAYEIRETKPENFDEFFLNLHNEGYVGCNVTVPFKERAFELVKQYGWVDDYSSKMKAVNTILIKDGILGFNTDGIGFIESILNADNEINPRKGKTVVLGAGGAARAVVNYLSVFDFPEILIVNRTKEKSVKIQKELKEKLPNYNVEVSDWEQRSEALKGANLLVNTTSLGMVGQPPLDIDLSLLPKDALVTDIVYRPLITPILQAAKDRGNPIVDGLGMLLYQAAPGFEMWFAEELKAKGIEKVEVTPELRKKIESLL